VWDCSTDLPAGSAKGSLTFGGAKAELKFATEFVDQKDDSKPVVLVISDQKLPVEKWVSESKMMLDENETLRSLISLCHCCGERKRGTIHRVKYWEIIARQDVR